MERDTVYTDKEIAQVKESIIKTYVDHDSEVSPKDVVFVTKEEYEANAAFEIGDPIPLIKQSKSKLNIIFDFSKYDGFWWTTRTGIVGIKLGWFGIFIATFDVIDLAAYWKRRAETVQNERDGLLQDNIDLTKFINKEH